MLPDLDTFIEALGIVLSNSEKRAAGELHQAEDRLEDRLLASISDMWSRVTAKFDDRDQRAAEAQKEQVALILEKMADEIRKIPPPPPTLVGVEAREDWTAREHVTVHRMSDGTEFETRSRMMPGVLPLDYAALGWGVIKGDMIRDGDFDRTALVDNPSIGRSDHWSVREVRGRRGRPGLSAVPAPAPTGKEEPD